MTYLPQRLYLLALCGFCASPVIAANAEPTASEAASSAAATDPSGSSTFSGSETESWIDPIVGVRSQAPLGEHWSVKTYGDIGGFGVSSHFTWQVLGLIEYDLSQRWSLAGGWRHLKTDFDQKGFVFDARMDGPILGAVYRF